MRGFPFERKDSGLHKNEVAAYRRNYHFGVRYYFNVNNEYIYPRIGLGYGWLTNYHPDDGSVADYDQTVHGLSLHLGVQFYSQEGLVISLDAAIGTKYAITRPETHPGFYNVYVRPTIGIGYDLTRLLSKGERKRRIQNSTIDPFQP